MPIEASAVIPCEFCGLSITVDEYLLHMSRCPEPKRRRVGTRDRVQLPESIIRETPTDDATSATATGPSPSEALSVIPCEHCGLLITKADHILHTWMCLRPEHEQARRRTKGSASEVQVSASCDLRRDSAIDSKTSTRTSSPSTSASCPLSNPITSTQSPEPNTVRWCCLCMELSAVYAGVPCGHLLYCVNCHEKEACYYQKKCPMCREEIVQLQRVFL